MRKKQADAQSDLQRQMQALGVVERETLEDRTYKLMVTIARRERRAVFPGDIYGSLPDATRAQVQGCIQRLMLQGRVLKARDGFKGGGYIPRVVE